MNRVIRAMRVFANPELFTRGPAWDAAVRAVEDDIVRGLDGNMKSTLVTQLVNIQFEMNRMVEKAKETGLDPLELTVAVEGRAVVVQRRDGRFHVADAIGPLLQRIAATRR